MNELREILQIVEEFGKDREVQFTFLDGVTIKYKNFEMVDESIYKSQDFCIAEVVGNNGYAEFNVCNIIKVVDVKEDRVLYEKRMS